MVWGCFTGSGRVQLAKNDGTMNSALYLKRKFVHQFVFLRSSALDLNTIDMLWHDVKCDIHAQKPSNESELKQFCQNASTAM